MEVFKSKREKRAKPGYEVVLDLGAQIGLCANCTFPVHEADITDGYAEACVDGGYECIQSKYADTCAEYAESHKEEVAAMLAERGGGHRGGACSGGACDAGAEACAGRLPPWHGLRGQGEADRWLPVRAACDAGGPSGGA